MPTPRSLLLAPFLAGLLLLPAPEAEAALCDGISDASPTPLTTVRVVSGLLRPLFVTAPAGDVDRLFIVEQDGRIRILRNGALLANDFLNVASLTNSPADGGDNEQGLLGLAFHPNYAANGFVYIFHTDTSGTSNFLVRYTRDALDPDRADPTTRTILLTIPHPNFGNHNGGMLAFAPDDPHLYLGTGDGGSGCDPNGNAQNPASLSGKMLRIDVDAAPVTVETWALGLRNPWRWAFDRLTSDLYIADVGQLQWEEVDFRAAPRSPGDNYGWDYYEGTHCPNPSCPGGTCPAIPGLVLPVAEYDHSSGACSITGGYPYRGCRMSALGGTYFYADYCADFIKSFKMSGGVLTAAMDRTAELTPGGGLAITSITSFGEDARGEIYIVDRSGEVFKILPILPNLQVSGIGAAPFNLGLSGWDWENLAATSGHPIASYHVYRSSGNGSGTFNCVFQSPAPMWPGGDPATPALGSLFSYVVTALNAAGAQTSPGAASDGTPRSISPLACP
ncbi:MAG TPA: PQQ-dependent sugar dehydrogenase [Candidatus Polarisedimenticolia bacterium]|nr:PQQ-dependent sugar dehydrogenase [Candidatus Polarisedimenticolia bacterium]